MPLSEHEQRILTEIEHQLRASDPDLARQVGETTVYSVPRRHARIAVAGLVVGLVVTLALLSVNPYVAFIVGFGLMFVSALALERSVRHLFQVGLEQLAATVKTAGVKDMFGIHPNDETVDPPADEPF